MIEDEGFYSSYFPSIEEFADPIVDFLEEGVLLCNVRSTYLDVLINHVQPIKMYLLDRYTVPKLNNFLGMRITELYTFKDDVIILAKYSDTYLYFHYDYDISDCAVGKLRSTETAGNIISTLEKSLDADVRNNKDSWKEGYDNGIIGYHEVPLCCLDSRLKG